ncbi:type IV pilus biogenesis protein PilM [Paenibacillus aquistagni]|uniref:Type IV pilus assembly protein PilM n=1 Tax=Paenibacillus aquistagni TaxID=1852522 RepID=A0A1X7LTF3_9BACL|nr:pilus assembly protein PilM [Paenibacillus aquistagni]SMG56603.1 type IV pilus assembly protein PilM [Paenibacillus aquistagni]
MRAVKAGVRNRIRQDRGSTGAKSADRKIPKKKMVSLVIKDHVIRYVDAKKPSLYGATSFGEVYLPSGIVQEGRIADPERLRAMLKEHVQKWKLRDREVQFIVPDSVVIVRKLEIPSDIPDEEIKGYLYLELGTSIHLPFEDPVFDIDYLERHEDKHEILLFAAPEQVVKEYAQLLSSVGLKPVAADISALAIYRLYYKSNDKLELELQAEAPLLSIQFDLQSVMVSIIHKHKVMLLRQFKMNLSIDNWESQLNKRGVLTPVWTGDESYLTYEINVMISEIQRVIGFYRSVTHHHEDEIDKIILTGDYPYLDDLALAMQESFGKLPFTFSKELFETQAKDLIEPKYYLALGLALKGGV